MPHQNNKVPESVTYEPEEEYQSLEEALTGEVKKKEPEGDPSY